MFAAFTPSNLPPQALFCSIDVNGDGTIDLEETHQDVTHVGRHDVLLWFENFGF